MLRVLPANAALRNWKIGHIFFENKFLEAENEVQKIVVPIQLLHVKVEGLRTQIDQDRLAFMSLNGGRRSKLNTGRSDRGQKPPQLTE